MHKITIELDWITNQLNILVSTWQGTAVLLDYHNRKDMSFFENDTKVTSIFIIIRLYYKRIRLILSYNIVNIIVSDINYHK